MIFIGSARYHVDGTFYNLPLAYPFVLFDLYGYVIIKSEHELRCKTNAKKKVHISNGIHNLKEYEKYHFIPKCLKEAHQLEKARKKALDKSYKPFRDIMALAVAKSGMSSLIPCR